MPRLDDSRIARATAALAEGAPDPAAFRYEPEYEAIAAEIGKLERNGPVAVDWPLIVRGAQEILASRSKDLSLATWLALALLTTEGIGGLAVGLAIVRESLDKFWDILFPTRARARAGALEWLIVRAARDVPETLAAGEGAAAVAALAELEGLDRLLGEKLPDQKLALGALRRKLGALAEEAGRAAAQAEEQKAREEAVAGAPTAAPDSSQVVRAAEKVRPAIEIVPADSDAEGDPERKFSALREAVRAAALQLMEASPAEARAFLLLRAVTWLGVIELPPARNGRTELLPPPETRLNEFAALRSAGNHKDLVLALERFCSGSGLFWLDGQRAAAMALGELGPAYAGCVRAIVEGVAALLGRLPGLVDLAFSDGTQFADGATRAWVAASVLAKPEIGEPAAADMPWQAALAEARRKMADGDAKEALALLTRGALAAPSGRARFHWRLGAARLCLENGTALVALPLLQHLARLCDVHGLDEWEPALVAEAALLLHRCLGAPDIARAMPDAERAEIARAAFARMARADPLLAVVAAREARN